MRIMSGNVVQIVLQNQRHVMEIVQMIIFFAMNIQNALKLQHLVKTNAFLRNNPDSKIKASTGIFALNIGPISILGILINSYLYMQVQVCVIFILIFGPPLLQRPAVYSKPIPRSLRSASKNLPKSKNEAHFIIKTYKYQHKHDFFTSATSKSASRPQTHLIEFFSNMYAFLMSL